MPSEFRETLRQLPNKKLREVIEESEAAIRQNRALLEDYSLFVEAQQELARRVGWPASGQG